MSKMLLVMMQEYKNRVRTRGFVIGTVAFPFLMALLTVGPSLLMTVKIDTPQTYAVVDSTGLMVEPLNAAMADTNKLGERLYTFVAENAGRRDHDGLVEQLGQQVRTEELGGFLILPENFVEGGTAEFYARNVSDMDRNQKLQGVLDGVSRQVRIQRLDIEPSKIQALMGRVSLSTFRVAETGEARADEGQTFLLAYLIGFIFYITLVLYGNATLRTTLEEKTERTAELMVSAVRPIHLLGGKVLGVALVSLTQLAIWFAAGWFLLTRAGLATGRMAQAAEFIQALSPPGYVVIYFFVFFILGFLFYSGLFVSVGAMVTSETEAQQLQFPVTFPIIVSLMLMFLAIRDPSGSLVQVISLIPLFSPIVMLVRICVVLPPFWEIALSLTFLALGVWGSIWMAGRIFRVGLLMYGKRPSLPELLKWIRY